jgi:hypothetical protein
MNQSTEFISAVLLIICICSFILIFKISYCHTKLKVPTLSSCIIATCLHCYHVGIIEDGIKLYQDKVASSSMTSEAGH